MGIKKFNGYIFESIGDVKELKLFFSPRLTSVLKSIDSNISRELLSSDIKSQYSYMDLTDGDETNDITVLPVNRLSRIEGITEADLENPSDNSVVWSKKMRQPFRLGTFISRLFPKYAGSRELELFVNKFRGKIDSANYELKIVRGEDIRKWYHVKYYFNPHPGIEDRPDEGVLDIRTPLMKSCLKQTEKQPFFNIYCKNVDQVGMLIMLNKEGKLVARALIWFDCFVADKAEAPTKGILLDRIYYTQESDVDIFIDYAKQHGWWYKPRQAKEVYSCIIDGAECTKSITTRLKVHGEFETYPYIDTMAFYTPDTGRLSTTRGKPSPNPKTGEIMERYQLQKTNGGKKRLSKDK